MTFLLRLAEVGPVARDAVVDDGTEFLEPPAAGVRVEIVDVPGRAEEAFAFQDAGAGQLVVGGDEILLARLPGGNWLSQVDSRS